MRARFLPVSANGLSQTVRIDSFPAVVSLDEHGEVCINGQVAAVPLCLLDDDSGNLILKDQAEDESVMVNDLPMSFGPLMPGDTLKLGGRRFLVSYERITSTPPPCPVFHFAAHRPTDLHRAQPAGQQT